MTWELDESLGTSSPPGLLLIATSANVNSWRRETFTVPNTGKNGFQRRNLERLVLLATNGPATSQLIKTDFSATFAFLTRRGQNVTLHVPARIYFTSNTDGNDVESSPIAWWDHPFPLPVRGGDDLTVFVPGDANATPTQDWELHMLFGNETSRFRRR